MAKGKMKGMNTKHLKKFHSKDRNISIEQKDVYKNRDSLDLTILDILWQN